MTVTGTTIEDTTKVARAIAVTIEIDAMVDANTAEIEDTTTEAIGKTMTGIENLERTISSLVKVDHQLSSVEKLDPKRRKRVHLATLSLEMRISS